MAIEAKKTSKTVTRQAPAQAGGGTPLLPAEFTRAMKSLSYRFLGLILILLSGALLLSLATYNPSDAGPNLSVTDGFEQVQNWLGPVGAMVADVLIMPFGYGAYALVLPMFLWGFKIIRMRWLPRFALKLAAVPVALAVLPIALALIQPFITTAFTVEPPAAPVDLGGFVGVLIAEKLMALSFMQGIPALAAAAAIILVFLPLYAFSFAMNGGEWRTVRRVTGAAILSVIKGIKAVVMAILRAIVLIFTSLINLFSGSKRRETIDEDDYYTDETEYGEESEPPTPEPSPLVAQPEDRVGILKKKRFKKKATPRKGSREAKDAQTSLDFGDAKGFKLPPLTLLTNPPPEIGDQRLSEEAYEDNARMLETVLDDFSVQGEIVKVRPGPVVTLYELEPAPGTKSARVIGLANDIARSMSAVSARVAVVPGRNAIGIELPNAKREFVYLRELLASRDFEASKGSLPLVLGKDIGGAPVIADMATMPHLLMAGRTGAGKSVGVNTFILSLLYRHTPENLRLILIDPKMLELSVYEGIPHLLTPVVTEAKKAVVALKWAVREMEDRYRNMSKLGVRNLAGYNKRVMEAKGKGETIKREVQTGFDRETGEPIYEEQEFDFEPLPQIVIIIDEMADLMIVAGKDVEATVQRLAQMARAAGIHVLIATQRPSVDVITGTIKANFPTRISFQVTSKIDSRTILGEQGAEQLLGKGDMLYMGGSGTMTRVHGAFVSDEEVEEVVRHLQRQGAPEYVAEVTEEPEDGYDSPFIPDSAGDAGAAGASDYDQAVAIVVNDQRASTSYIQRRMGIGYNKAANLIEQMERDGIVSAPNHKGQREIYAPKHDDVP